MVLSFVTLHFRHSALTEMVISNAGSKLKLLKVSRACTRPLGQHPSCFVLGVHTDCQTRRPLLILKTNELTFLVAVWFARHCICSARQFGFQFFNFQLGNSSRGLMTAAPICRLAFDLHEFSCANSRAMSGSRWFQALRKPDCAFRNSFSASI